VSWLPHEQLQRFISRRPYFLEAAFWWDASRFAFRKLPNGRYPAPLNPSSSQKIIGKRARLVEQSRDSPEPVVAITMRQGDSASDQRHRLAKSSHEAVAALIATQTYCRIPFLPAWWFWGVYESVAASLCPLTLFEKRRCPNT